MNTFQFLIEAFDAWDNSNCPDAIYDYGSIETVGPLAEGSYWLGAYENDHSLRWPEDDQQWRAFEVCCAEPPQPVTDMRIARDGASLHFTWSDTVGAQEYLLVQDTTTDGEFDDVVQVATSGASGITEYEMFLDGFFRLREAAGCPD